MLRTFLVTADAESVCGWDGRIWKICCVSAIGDHNSVRPVDVERGIAWAVGQGNEVPVIRVPTDGGHYIGGLKRVGQSLESELSAIRADQHCPPTGVGFAPRFQQPSVRSRTGSGI